MAGCLHAGEPLLQVMVVVLLCLPVCVFVCGLSVLTFEIVSHLRVLNMNVKARCHDALSIQIPSPLIDVETLAFTQIIGSEYPIIRGLVIILCAHNIFGWQRICCRYFGSAFFGSNFQL